MSAKIIELVCVLFCLMLFVRHFILHKITNDDSKQYLVFIMFIFYSLTVIYDLTVKQELIVTHNNITLVRHFMVIASFFAATMYVRTLFDDFVFNIITNCIFDILIIEFILYIIMIPLRYSTKVIDYAVIMTAVLSLICYIIFLIQRWNSMNHKNRIMLLSMFITVLCFTLMEESRLAGFKYKFIFCYGMIIYMQTYEIISFKRISSLLSKNAKAKCKTLPTANNPFALTKTEQEIVDLMRMGETSSKDIAKTMDKRPETIDRHIKNIMAKVTCNNRKDIIDIICGETDIQPETD